MAKKNDEAPAKAPEVAPVRAEVRAASAWRKAKSPQAWAHAAAAALHGWADHAHHENEEFQLTESDYVAAIAAASQTDKSGGYTPHRPAMSQHAAKAKEVR